MGISAPQGPTRGRVEKPPNRQRGISGHLKTTHGRLRKSQPRALQGQTEGWSGLQGRFGPYERPGDNGGGNQ